MNSLLKFITCGSVDDGKSTLIGHMLYDAKLIFADQERALELDSKVGSRGGKLDYSLLLDGLMAEREQGITIDVAYRYFSTEKRSFIVADTPGHEEYTRNMAVGASFADLAVILVDASQGLLIQTRRHTRVCGLMGIRHFVFAVNKMDLIGYDEDRFRQISDNIHLLIQDIEGLKENVRSLCIIPVSATEGDNLTNVSQNMPWYEGPTLLHHLETIDVDAEDEEGFVMPVQRVCRPDASFRGFQGEIASGKVTVGDALKVLPSGEEASINRILCAGQECKSAFAGQPVTIVLDREVDISRGCVLTNGTSLHCSNIFSAEMLWMDDAILVEGRQMMLKIGTRLIPATVMKLKYSINVNTGEHLRIREANKNDLIACDIKTSEKVVFDKFSVHKSLGHFILIDRLSNMTSACGVVTHELTRSDNLFYQNLDITREYRAQRLGQKPVTIWFTGLSGAGKSTLMNALEKALASQGRYTMALDGDNVRMGLNCNLGFTEGDRIENIRRVAEVAKLMNDAGLIVLTAFISPFSNDRKMARKIIGDGNFVEIYVSTPISECEKRDVKGLYAKARQGNIPNFTGISSPYEIPESPEITVDTCKCSVDECVNSILSELVKFIG